MKTWILPILVMFPLALTAQIRYAEGYFISHENITTNCLIHHVDWLNNPTSFRYKMNADAEVLTADLSQVKAFGVAGSKFINASIKADTSARETKNLTRNRQPEWKDMQVFLKVLTEGKATLYSLRTPLFEVYFYSLNGSPPKQLVYKEFLTENTLSLNVTGPRGIAKNLTYVQQLKTEVLCGAISDAQLKTISYQKVPLQKYFDKYNVCHGGVTLNRASEQRTRFFINSGADFSEFKLSDDLGYDKEYEKSISFRIGVTAEYVLPFNNGKWSVLMEPTYQTYKSGELVKYRSLEVPLGLRHTFHLTGSTRLFLNGSMVLDLPLKYEVKWTPSIAYTAKRLSASFAPGAGVSVNRFTFEGRKYFRRSVLSRESGLFFVHSKLAFILGFRIR